MNNKKITLITILSISVVFICHGGDSGNENLGLESYLNGCMNKGSTIRMNINKGPTIRRNIVYDNQSSPLPPLPPPPPPPLPDDSNNYSQQNSTNVGQKAFKQAGKSKKHVMQVHKESEKEKRLREERLAKSIEKKGNEIKEYSENLEDFPKDLMRHVIGACLTYLKSKNQSNP